MSREAAIADLLNQLNSSGLQGIAPEADVLELISDYFVSDETEEEDDDFEQPVSSRKVVVRPLDLADDEPQEVHPIQTTESLVTLVVPREPVADEPPFICACQYYDGKPCYQQFAPEDLMSARLQGLELTNAEHDVAVTSHLSSCMHRGATTLKSKRKEQIWRERTRTQYYFAGLEVNKNLLLLVGTSLLGAFTVATPYCTNYGAMICIRTAVGISSGIIDTGGNALQMMILGNEGQVLMQLLHFSFALGGVISPLYCEPFLAQKVEDESVTFGSNLTTPENVTITEVPMFTTTNVQYAFLITGICCFVSAVSWLVFLILEKMDSSESTNSVDDIVLERPLSRSMRLFMLILLCSFYMLYSCVEDSFAAYLMTFLVKSYSFVSKSDGAHITAIYWGSFAGSRFLMIFLAKCLSPLQLLCICCLLMTFTFTGFMISAFYASLAALTVFSVMAGLSMSAVFPAGFSWTETELLRVTGWVSSCILVSSSTGTMVNPLLLGFLMERVTTMWFCYLLLIQTLILCLIFVFLLTLSRCHLQKKFGPVRPTIELCSNHVTRDN